MKAYLIKKTIEICVYGCQPRSEEKCYYTISPRKANAKFEEWKKSYAEEYALDTDDNETEFFVEKELNDWDTKYIHISIKEIEIEE